MKKFKMLIMFLAVSLFSLNGHTVSAELVKLWDDGINISRTDGSKMTYGHGRKASDNTLFAYYSIFKYDWTSYTWTSGIYVQKIGRDGRNLWGDVGKLVEDSYGYSTAMITDLVPDSNGGAVVVYEQESLGSYWRSKEIRAKRFDSNGNEDTSWGEDGVLVSTDVKGSWGWASNFAISDGTNGAIVVWQSQNHWAIHAQRIGTNGELKWNNGEPVFVGDGGLSSSGDNNNVVSDGNGGIFIAWDSSVQHLDSNGIPQWQLGGIGIAGGYYPVHDLKPDGSGGVIITSGYDVQRVQRVDSHGNLPWGIDGIRITIKGDAGSDCIGGGYAFLESLGNGEFAIVWARRESDVSLCIEADIYAQKIDIDGNLKWNPDGVIVSGMDEFDTFVQVASDGKDGIWIAFVSTDTDDENGIWYGKGYFGVQHVDNGGNTFACSPIRQKNYNTMTWFHTLVPDGEGGVYLLWDSVSDFGDVYAQRFAKIGQREANCGMIAVVIDIKPGSMPNSINLLSKGVVPVAVLTTEEFDALTIDTATVVFAGANVFHNNAEDVNEDGMLDMIFHFNTEELNFDPTSMSATLTGKTTEGRDIQGQDTVNIVPKRK